MHLFVAVTAHGYGHLAQVAPVARALARRLPELRVTLQGTVARRFATARMPPGYRTIDEAADVALPMDGPLHVRWEEGLRLFTAFDADHERHLARQRALLAQDPPDLVLADVPWLPLTAARELGVPSAALCSLNWLDILAESPVGAEMPPALAKHMRDAYAGADLFLRPAPAMPMRWLPNARAIGPIAKLGRRDPERVRRCLGIPPGRRLVLMLFGGAGRLALGDAGALPDDVHLLTPDPQDTADRHRCTLIGGTGAAPDDPGLQDVLASSDAIITKPGYGTFAEAACSGVPVLYVRRDDWPEERHLVDWLAARVPTRAVSPGQFATGAFGEPLRQLLDAGCATPVPANGADEAAQLLRGLLPA